MRATIIIKGKGVDYGEKENECILRFFSALKPVKLCIASVEVEQALRSS